MTSARPFEIALSVENRWKTRTGSSVLSTVTAEPSQMRDVRPAIAARTTSGAEMAKSRAMMLADSETIEADLLRKDRLVDDMAQHFRLGQLGAGRIERHVAERIDAKFEGFRGGRHPPTLPRRAPDSALMRQRSSGPMTKSALVVAAIVLATPLSAQQPYTPARYAAGARPVLPVLAVGGGQAFVELTIGPDGAVQKVTPLRSTPPFTQGLIDAVTAWRFSPAIEDALGPDGKPAGPEACRVENPGRVAVPRSDAADADARGEDGQRRFGLAGGGIPIRHERTALSRRRRWRAAWCWSK